MCGKNFSVFERFVYDLKMAVLVLILSMKMNILVVFIREFPCRVWCCHLWICSLCHLYSEPLQVLFFYSKLFHCCVCLWKQSKIVAFKVWICIVCCVGMLSIMTFWYLRAEVGWKEYFRLFEMVIHWYVGKFVCRVAIPECLNWWFGDVLRFCELNISECLNWWFGNVLRFH